MVKETLIGLKQNCSGLEAETCRAQSILQGAMAILTGSYTRLNGSDFTNILGHL